MKEPSLKLIREELGEALKSLPADELDREALKIWKEEKKKYEKYCSKNEEEIKGLEKGNFLHIFEKGM